MFQHVERFQDPKTKEVHEKKKQKETSVKFETEENYRVLLPRRLPFCRLHNKHTIVTSERKKKERKDERH